MGNIVFNFAINSNCVEKSIPDHVEGTKNKLTVSVELIEISDEKIANKSLNIICMSLFFNPSNFRERLEPISPLSISIMLLQFYNVCRDMH